jgi:hypothetical protein
VRGDTARVPAASARDRITSAFNASSVVLIWALVLWPLTRARPAIVRCPAHSPVSFGKPQPLILSEHAGFVLFCSVAVGLVIVCGGCEKGGCPALTMATRDMAADLMMVEGWDDIA